MTRLPDGPPAGPAAGPGGGQRCDLLALDIAGFTRPDWDEEARIHLPSARYEILIIIVPPEISPRGIIGPFPGPLNAPIRVHNRMPAPAARSQVRAAARIGPVYRDGRGLTGDDINLLFRMLDARPLHAALASSAAGLALAISPCTLREETLPPQGRMPALVRACGAAGEDCQRSAAAWRRISLGPDADGPQTQQIPAPRGAAESLPDGQVR